MSEIIKTSQEQAVGAWVNYLNQVRLNKFIEFMAFQDNNFKSAMQEMRKALAEIQHIKLTNRGGEHGMHGFLAEVAQVGIGNARENIIGNKGKYKWINDNSVKDIVYDNIDIQMKFYNKDLSLGAVKEHLKKYPDFLKNGGKYQIPRDQYDRIKYLMSVTKEQANKMPTKDSTFSLKQWKMVHDFFEEGQAKINDMEPSILDYKAVQRDKIDFTMDEEKNSLKKTDANRREEAYKESLPSFKEGVKVTAASAGIEGFTALVTAIWIKRKQRGKLNLLTEDDWKEILGETFRGSIKGSVRGVSMYMLTNYTATPAAVAGSLVTVSFAAAEQTHLYRNGKLSKKEFLENLEKLCLDGAVSSLSSLLGQVLIPIPILGAVIGNSLGTMMYKISKDAFNENEQKLIEEYIKDIECLKGRLNKEYIDHIELLKKNFNEYLDILESLYSPDIMAAFEGSIRLAREFNIPSGEILDSEEKIHDYFVN